MPPLQYINGLVQVCSNSTNHTKAWLVCMLHWVVLYTFKLIVGSTLFPLYTIYWHVSIIKQARGWSIVVHMYANSIVGAPGGFQSPGLSNIFVYLCEMKYFEFEFLSLCIAQRESRDSCQIRKIAGAHAPGMPGTFSPSPQVSDPDMHHGTCVTHVPWCMPGSLTSSFLWNRRRGKTFPAFPAHAQPAILRIW